MCNFNNSTNANNLLKANEDGAPTKRYNNLQALCETKPVVEDYDIELDGEDGTGGRPRFREEVKLPPDYNIDLNDPDDEILFQGELVKFKPGYNAIFLTRWVQVTEKAFRIYKNRGNAITFGKKPLLAVPVAAFKKIDRTHMDLPVTERDKPRYEVFIENLFEIYLKEDFIELFVSPQFDSRQGEKQQQSPQQHLAVPQPAAMQ